MLARRGTTKSTAHRARVGGAFCRPRLKFQRAAAGGQVLSYRVSGWFQVFLNDSEMFWNGFETSPADFGAFGDNQTVRKALWVSITIACPHWMYKRISSSS